MIPISRPQIGPEEEAAVMAVLRSGMLVQGHQVEALEAAFAKLCGVSHAVAVSSGTAALHLALLANGVGPGDEVITTPFSFIATANSILMAGAKPVFVDVHNNCFNLDAGQIEAAITPRTRAIMPVHLYGHPAEMATITAIAQRHGLAIIEDAAQAVGATYHNQPIGGFGTGCFSLYATKNIMSAEGGIITTDDQGIAERLRLLRSHGSRVRYYHDDFGYNFRLTDLHAAIGVAQFAKLEAFTARRIANAAYLSTHIRHPLVVKPHVRAGVRHVFHQYTIRVPGEWRDAAVRQLQAAGVGSAVFYPVPIPQQTYYRKLGYEVELPVSDQMSREVLSLPVHPALSEDDLTTIAAAVNGLQLA
ncbi:MAG: DegT/DnrJ/EryC1/StrS family aminotransferase [Chloroflexaceae bacterium]|jgi:dTDP-4-amino-4,6-dideoxygalactose transaminase|nr:DegT/DnrJ/EryC1/StrS family aminotransferase [Chloroflexaceae bacterium]